MEVSSRMLARGCREDRRCARFVNRAVQQGAGLELQTRIGSSSVFRRRVRFGESQSRHR